MVVLAGIVAGFLFQRQTGLSPSVVALLGAGVLILLSPLRVGELLKEVEWETLAFFIGLFILVGALVRVGALEELAGRIADADRGAVAPTLMVVLGGSAVASAVVDNIPFVTAMTPVVDSLIAPTRPWARMVPCGGRWPWGLTSGATPPWSGPAPTWYRRGRRPQRRPHHLRPVAALRHPHRAAVDRDLRALPAAPLRVNATRPPGPVADVDVAPPR